MAEQKLSKAKQEVRRHIFNNVDEDVILDVFEGSRFQNKDKVGCMHSKKKIKRVGWEVIFLKHGFERSRKNKPRWELKGSALDFFCKPAVLRLQGASIVQVKYHIKASVKIIAYVIE